MHIVFDLYVHRYIERIMLQNNAYNTTINIHYILYGLYALLLQKHEY